MDALKEITTADLLLHLCPEEPFGLVLREAFLARVPVLVPDESGVAEVVQGGKAGFQLKAEDADSLADALRNLRETPAVELNRIVNNASHCYRELYSDVKVIQSTENSFGENSAK